MSKKLTISAVSTLAAPTSTMKPSFAVNPNENMMEATSEKAPVILTMPSAGTVRGEEFTKAYAESCDSMSVTEAARRINVLGETILAMAEEAKNFKFPLGFAEIAIEGSLENADDVPGEENVAYYSITLKDEVRKLFAAIKTKIDAEACPADLKRVRDVETEGGSIRGKKKFFAQGVKLTYGGAGEKLELYKEDQTTFVCDVKVVEHDPAAVSLTAKLKEALEPGRYFLKLTTLAGGDKTLYPVGIYVTVVEGPEPPPLAFTKVYSTALGEEGKWKSFRDTLECTLNDDIPEDAIICHRLVEIATGREVTRVKLSSKNVVTKLDDEKFSLRVTENNSDETDGTWCNAELYRPEVIVESASRGTITAPVVAVVDVA